MFTEPICEDSLLLCGAEAAEVFPNVQTFLSQPDYSFLATLRAMLPQRMEPTDTIRVGLDHHGLGSDFFEKASKKKVIQTLLHQIVSIKNCIALISLDSTGVRAMDIVRTKVTEVYPSFKFLDSVSYYISQKDRRPRIALISETDRVAVVIGESISLSDWHYVQSVIPMLLPWYFTTPLAADDSAILHALTQSSSRDYVTVMERISLDMDLRAIKVRKMLAGLEREFLQTRIEEMMRRIKSLDDEIELANLSMAKKISDKYEAQITLCGLSNMDEPKDSELAEFFAKNKSLHIVKAGNGMIEYIVTGYLTEYDMKILNNDLRNRKSYFYRHHPNAKLSAEDSVKLIRAIFSPNPLCKLRVFAAFDLRLGGSLSHKRNYIFPDWFNTFIAHPHIDTMGCLGGNLQHINSAMVNQDYITAISQTMAAVRNINFADGAVVPKFIEALRIRDPLCIEMRDGSYVRPSDAVRLLDSPEE
jgi:hypothetical protein